MKLIKHVTHFEVIPQTNDEEAHLAWLLGKMAEASKPISATEGATSAAPIATE